MGRKEIWLYERIEADGEIFPHLYAVLSDEHPGGLDGLSPAEFLEDVYLSNRRWRKIDHGVAFENLKNDAYRYINYSYRCIQQEWTRPVFASKKVNGRNHNLLWESFLKQASPLLVRTRNKGLQIKENV